MPLAHALMPIPQDTGPFMHARSHTRARKHIASKLGRMATQSNLGLSRVLDELHLHRLQLLLILIMEFCCQFN